MDKGGRLRDESDERATRFFFLLAGPASRSKLGSQEPPAAHKVTVDAAVAR